MVRWLIRRVLGVRNAQVLLGRYHGDVLVVSKLSLFGGGGGVGGVFWFGRVDALIPHDASWN
jgi:hypothetical protein